MKTPFTRPETPSQNLRLTQRDIDILTYLHTFRFLTAEITSQLLNMPLQTARHRLRLMWEHGYTDRPPIQKQLWNYHIAGSHPLVYALSDKGAKILHRERHIPTNKDRRYRNNQYHSELHFKHDLAIPETVAILAQATRTKGYTFLDHHQVQGGNRVGDYRSYLMMTTMITAQGKATKKIIKPDYACGIQLNPERDPNILLLEIDRGSEQVKYKDQNSATIEGKYQAYNAAHEQKLFQARYNTNFRVLVITTNPQRRDYMLKRYQKRKTYTPWLFLFADQSILTPETILTETIYKGNGQLTTLGVTN